MYGFMLSDVIDAWPATDRFTHGVVERLRVLPRAIAGRAAARRDIEDGRLTLLLWGGGIPLQTRRAFAERLAERGIALRVVGGCVVPAPQLAARRGYDDVMSAEIDRRYGAGFLRNTFEEAAQRAARF